VAIRDHHHWNFTSYVKNWERRATSHDALRTSTGADWLLRSVPASRQDEAVAK
jgi:hypothetical protein